MLERTSGGYRLPSSSSSRDASRDVSALKAEMKGKWRYVRDMAPVGPRMFGGLGQKN